MAIGTDVDAGGTGRVGMRLGVGFVAVAEHGRGRHCQYKRSRRRRRRRRRMNRVAALSEGLRGWWWQDTRNPGLLGPPDARKITKKQLEVVKQMENTFETEKEHDLRAVRAWRRGEVVGKGRKRSHTQPLDRCADLRSGTIELAKCILGMHLLLDACILRSRILSEIHYTCTCDIFL